MSDELVSLTYKFARRAHSQLHGLGQHTGAQQLIEPPLRDHLHATAEQLFEVGDQAAWEPGTGLGTHFDKQIYVTVWPRVAVRHGPEHPHACDA